MKNIKSASPRYTKHEERTQLVEVIPTIYYYDEGIIEPPSPSCGKSCSNCVIITSVVGIVTTSIGGFLYYLCYSLNVG